MLALRAVWLASSGVAAVWMLTCGQMVQLSWVGWDVTDGAVPTRLADSNLDLDLVTLLLSLRLSARRYEGNCHVYSVVHTVLSHIALANCKPSRDPNYVIPYTVS